MGKILVIAEKPSVGSDIARVLGCTDRQDGYIEGDNYIVTWAVGHLIGLKYPDEHNEAFKTWKLEDLPFCFPVSESLKVLPNTDRQFGVIKKLINRNDVDSLINAGDAGREGYLIQEWIYRMSGNQKPVKVLWASSVTDEALKKAFLNLKDDAEFTGLLNEAEARAEGDFLLGINYSRALTLTKAENTSLSYGRCQTPLLQLIAKRDQDIENFKSEPFYQVETVYKKGFKGILIDENKKATVFSNVSDAEVIKLSADGKQAEVIEYIEEEKKKKPPLLFDLATLQKAMGRQYGFTPDQTLKIAQALYEKHKILSYPRTDSQYLSNDLYNEISEHILSCNFALFKELIAGIDFKTIKADKRYFNDLKVTDHHALIPTINNDTEAVYKSLSPDEKKVFDAVVLSLLAIFYPDYEYSVTTIITKIEDYHFLSRGNTVKKWGFKEILKNEEDEKKDTEEEKQILPILKQADLVTVNEINVLAKKTTAPPKYTVATLISLMEKYKIGTAATRAEIIKSLMNPKRTFVTLEKGKYSSTSLGRSYIQVIPEQLKSPDLTMKFEEQLQKINQGEISKEQFLEEFTEEFKVNLAEFQKDSGNKIIGASNIIGYCPFCKKEGKDAEMYQGEKNFYCSSYKAGCNFVIWKTIAGKQLTINQVQQLLQRGVTAKIGGFKKKAGGTFTAALYIKKDKTIGFKF